MDAGHLGDKGHGSKDKKYQKGVMKKKSVVSQFVHYTQKPLTGPLSPKRNRSIVCDVYFHNIVYKLAGNVGIIPED